MIRCGFTLEADSMNLFPTPGPPWPLSTPLLTLAPGRWNDDLQQRGEQVSRGAASTPAPAPPGQGRAFPRRAASLPALPCSLTAVLLRGAGAGAGRPGPVLPATGGVSLPLGFSLNSHGPTERSHFLLSGRKVVFTSTRHFYFYFSVCPDSGWEKRTFREPNVKLDWEDIRLEIRRPVGKLLCVPIKMMRA